MASITADPLITLQAALTVPANSQEQADILATLREHLESHPAPIPVLVGTFIATIVNAGDSLFKRWIIDLLHFAICRSNLSVEQRTQLSQQTLDTLAQLLGDPNPTNVKVAVQCFTTVYPLLFRFLCTNRNNPASWNTLSACKARILEFVDMPHVNAGVRLSAIKFLQRVLVVQTRGISDPRLQNKNDPNISMCPADHPFISVARLEAEGSQLLEKVMTILYGRNTDMISALLNSWISLIKLRPTMVSLIITVLKQWTPAALVGLPASSIKSVEKSIRILLTHLLRVANNGQFVGQINEALAIQGVRMDKAAAEEKKRKAAALSGLSDARKRTSSNTPEQPSDPKRPKLDPDSSATASIAALASFDFTSLSANLITDLVVANLEAISESTLVDLVHTYRQSRGINVPPLAQTLNIPVAPKAERERAAAAAAAAAERASSIQPEFREPPTEHVKDEQLDLNMDVDQDELEFEPDKLNEELSGIVPSEFDLAVPGLDATVTDLKLVDFTLPSPSDLGEDERINLINSTIARIRNSASEITLSDTSRAGGSTPTEMWMLLLVRMVTRMAEPPPLPDDNDTMDNELEETGIYNLHARQDQLRQSLCNYIITDFPARLRLATTWMNEEWYNDQTRMRTDPNWRPNYDIWLNQIVASYETFLDGKDKDNRTFSQFLLDLPYVPPDVLGLLRELCVESASSIGYKTLRGLVAQRPSMRAEALNVLLELTTHPVTRTRGAAINTVKGWVPDAQPMSSMVREFALQLLRKLQLRPEQRRALKAIPVSDENQDTKADTIQEDVAITTDAMQDQDMVEAPPTIGEELEEEEDPFAQEDLVHTPYLPERIELPAQKPHVLQHLELLFALSVRDSTFLDDIFHAYQHMDSTVQDAVQDLITALVRSLGSSNGKLLTLLRTCPAGSESLALRVLTIFTEHERASPQLVALVKALINERNLDARFLIPIIAEMDKTDIVKYLPRIVSILNGTPENKKLVRSVFSSVVTLPSQSFGSVTSNLPRVRQSELLTPAELMVLLHDSEKEIGLKAAMEAIGICFSMTDVFRPEIFGVVMQQIVDEPVLPVLFLRTVIQAVTTYTTLVGFVSTTLFSRLITKKIWTNAPLWGGFIRCAKMIAPASFGALLQLPREQLRELVDKQPSLKSDLRDYVRKKAPNKARGAGFLDIFGESEESPAPQLMPDSVASAV